MAEIRRLNASQNEAVLRKLLSDTRELTARTLNDIESLAGAGTQTTAGLAELCDILSRSSEAANTGEALNVESMETLLTRIQGLSRDEIKPDKLEIVFLPYKASMWDCFESVWSAAKADPRCDAFVVPIPYFDRTQSGEFGEMHYEISQYPSCVPVINWREYDIEARRPDAIFIHNPYDDYNNITSVHPDFYSKRLKSFTDLLIYIPYFVSSDDDVDKDLCVLPGTLYADRVIVQSEEVRQYYIHMFKDAEETYNCAGQFGNAEEKFVALGSPKFDLDTNGKPEDYQLPAEWRRLFERPDGTTKKAVLYNTSIGTLLNCGEKYIAKLKSVLNIFKQREEVVLWWRPHPLSEATYNSMLSEELLDEYQRIVENYKLEGWGIYDETGDLHRAIALTAGYFGDKSSLVALYQRTGKRILLQNPIQLFDKQNRDVPIYCFDNIEKSILWIMPVVGNRLFRLNMDSLDYQFVGRFPNNPIQSSYPYVSATRIENDVYFAPFRANNIAVYHANTGDFSTILIPEPIFSVTNLPNFKRKFSKIIPFGYFLFLIPFSYPAIIRYDTLSGRMEQFTDWIEPTLMTCNEKERKKWRFFKSVKVIGSEIYASVFSLNAVLVFNMEKCSSKLYRGGESEQVFTDLCFDGEYFWLMPENTDSLVRWDKNNDRYEYLKIITEGALFTGFVEYLDGWIWLLPIWGEAVLRINAHDLSIEPVHALMEIIEQEKVNHINKHIDDANYFSCDVTESQIVSYCNKTAEIISYEPETKRLRRLRLAEDIVSYDSFDTDYGKLFDNRHYTLNNFINELITSTPNHTPLSVRTRFQKNALFANDGTAGEQIFSFILKELFEN